MEPQQSELEALRWYYAADPRNMPEGLPCYPDATTAIFATLLDHLQRIPLPEDINRILTEQAGSPGAFFIFLDRTCLGRVSPQGVDSGGAPDCFVVMPPPGQ